jgi:hypothetical protein
MTPEYSLVEDKMALLSLRDAVASVYLSTYRLPPYRETQEDIDAFKVGWPALINKSCFRLVTARDPSTRALLGFAYGWRLTRTDPLHVALVGGLDPEKASLWVSDSFELGDFAILPSEQGRGVGKEVYALLFKGLRQRRAVLKTHASPSVAFHMYRKRGWTKLIDQFVWGPKKLPYTAMGILL